MTNEQYKIPFIVMFFIIIGILAVASPVQGLLQDSKPQLSTMISKPSTEDLIKQKDLEAQKNELLSEKAKKEKEALEVQKKLDELEAPKPEAEVSKKV